MNSKRMITVSRLLFTLALMALTLAAAESMAGEKRPKGMFLGINAGYGGSSYFYEEGSRSISGDSASGALGALRFGYAISSKLALSIEGYGFGDTSDEDDAMGLGAGLIAVTWRPVGTGFFVRAGVGGGGGSMLHPDTGEKVTIRDRCAGMFGVGYDWMLGSKTSLGLSFDGMAIDTGTALGYDEEFVSTGGMTLQFTWHL